MRKIKFVNGESYHIYNRGTDKRDIFSDYEDLARFFQSMDEFNTVDPIGSIYENSFKDLLGHPMYKLQKTDKLVNFVCYCLNSNHYHFILEQICDDGIQKFMQRLGNGFTKYFNNKHKRSGVLFQGKFKSVHVDSNEYLLYLSTYVNLNNKVHQLGHSMSKLSKSSWEEYIGNDIKNTKYKNFCEKDIILNQFNSREEYKKFAEDSLIVIKENKEIDKLEEEF